MAQVKLQFRNAIGDKLVITRSMTVTVSKTSVSQKQVDCNLLMWHHGERINVSTKVAELNQVTPEHLGVSPAILEFVIFCHQEESLWPMSEPAPLKKKFDEIFQAQKYTKAIDNLKLMRKARVAELAILKEKEKGSRVLKDKAEKVSKRALDLQDEVERLREQLKSLESDIAAASADSKEKHLQARKALGIVDDLRAKNEQANNLQKTLDMLGENFVELKESDDWLQSTLEQYEERMAQYQEQEGEITTQYRDLQQTISDCRQTLSEKQAERGQYQAEKENYERQIQSRVDLVKEAARSHAMRGYDGDLDEDHVQEFVRKVQKLSLEKDRELDRIKKATEDELRGTQAELTELANRKATQTQEKVNARRAITENERKLNGWQQAAGKITMDAATKAALEASLNDIQQRLRQLTTEYEAAAWDSALNTEKSHLRELESESARLMGEMRQVNKLAKDRAELEYVSKEMKKSQRDLDITKSTYNEQLSLLLGPDWSPDTLEQDFQAVLLERSRAFTEAKNQQEGIERELRDMDAKLKTHRTTLAKKKEEKQKCQAAVLTSITRSDLQPITSVDEYEPELETLRTERENIQRDLEGVMHVSDWYAKALDTATKQNCCRLCERGFADKNEQSKAIQKINRELAKNVRDQFQADLRNIDQDLKKADAARGQYEVYKTLSEVEIPALEKEIKKAEDEKIPLVKRAEEWENEVREKESAKKAVEDLANNVNKIVKYTADISMHEEKISRLSSQQKLSGSSLTADEIDEQQTACGERIRTQKAKIEKLSTDKDNAKSMISNLELEVASTSNKLSSAKNDLEKKQGLLAEIDELRESTTQQRNIIQRADAELQSLEPEVEKAKARHEDAKQRGQTKEGGVRVEKDKLAQTVNRFNLIEKSINSYIEGGGPGKLAASQRAIKSLEQDQKRIESEIQTVTKKGNDLKKQITESDRTKLSIFDNIRMRKARRELAVVKDEISELDSRNVTDDYDQLRHEAEVADKHYEKLTSERGLAIGSIRTQDKQVGELMEEWEVEYKDAAMRFREDHVKVETTKAAIDDLGKCTHALDGAIMQYHTMKMEEINAIAGELWRNTYQGTDVDTIMIRSENENAKAKRNYNYRVVMIKSGAEMDMRGRCSAGQKVLASIIIRLALAECFGVNCGVS